MNPLSNPSYLLPPLVVLAISLILIVVIWRGSRWSFSSCIFCGLLLSVGLWGLLIFGMRSSPDVHSAVIWDRMVITVGYATYLLYYHFTLVYTNTSGQRRTLLAGYLFLALSFALVPTDLLVQEMRLEHYGYAPTMGPIFAPLILTGLFLIGRGVYNLVRHFNTSDSHDERNRTLYLIIAVLISVLGALLDAFSNLPPALIWCNLVFCIICSVAIMRYHLLDIRIIARKGLAYLLVSSWIAIPYVGLLYLLHYIFEPALESWWLHAIFILLLATILRPLYSWAQQFVDRVFYRDRYDYLRELERFSNETQSITNLTELGSMVVKLVSGALRTTSVCLLLSVKAHHGLVVASSTGLDNSISGVVLRESSPLIKWLALHGDIVSSEQLDIIPQLQNLSARDSNNLEKIGAKLFVPIKRHEGELSGVLVLGQKLSQQTYSNEDKQLLIALVGQMSVALQNARLYSDALQARESLERWLDSMTDYVMIVNAAYTVEFMNRAAIVKLGSRVGENCWDTIRKETACLGCPIQSYVHGNTKGLHYSQNIGDKEYDIAAVPLSNPDGSLSVIEVLRDITERKQMEEERHRLERLESVGTLAGGIAHDFNNLLTGIMGNIGLAKRYVEPKSKAETSLIEAEKASLRAKDLTQQLLTFARGGAPIRETASIAELIKDSATFVLSGSNVRPQFFLPDGPWPVEVDQGQMAQVINNLIINADEAMPDGGELNVKAQNTLIDEKSTLPLKKGKYIEISVEDHGIGMSKEHLSRIFEPYFTTKQKGSGLGLSTVYSIVKNHDGYVTVKSKLEVGTTFYIYLPASKKPIPKKEGVAVVETRIAGKGGILVMDDEEVIRELLHDELTDVGYEVELTVDGAEAIERYTRAKESGQPFAAVILDLTVPGGIGGKEVIKKLLEIDPGVKAIVSSGYSTDPIMSDYKKYGFSGVLGKPYIIEELTKAVDKVLQGKKK